jgi:2-phosphosulfolactate phosphatase
MSRNDEPWLPDSGAASVYGQSDYEVRFDWGLDGALAVGVDVDVVVVVDVLSFTTAVSVAVDSGAVVYPYRWRDNSVYDFATARGAVVAVNRGEEGISLSPVSMGGLSTGDRIVLPSPNGATICAALAERGVSVIAGSIRNAAQVSALINERDWSVAVVAAGEHWRATSSVRPCFEDVVGAGAILARLSRHSHSPESLTAIGAFTAVASDLLGALQRCVAGRELAAWGYAGDVEVAATRDPRATVPLLSSDGSFDAGARSR